MSEKADMAVDPPAPKTKPLNVVSAMFGECLCEPFPSRDKRGREPEGQFVELHGIEFIALGALFDERTAKQRVTDTVNQLADRTERLISIGCLINDKSGADKVFLETEPLEIWNKRNDADEKKLLSSVQRMTRRIKRKEFAVALEEFGRELALQKAKINKDNNKYLVGITAHNMAVVCVLACQDDNALNYFRDAVEFKQRAFGDEHPEVALSLHEVGIQLFARGQFDDALGVFNDAKKIYERSHGLNHPKLAMVLNNIACCNFQMRNHLAALVTFQEVRTIQQHAMGSSSNADLDLLHVAIALCNLGYMKLQLKRYEDARETFEEALLVQQSVLGDAHTKAIQDTLSNIEFANAFHS